MIFDTLENANKYKGINPNLDKALDFIQTLKSLDLEVGKHSIDGDNMFYMVQDYLTQDEAMCKYESHRKYIDIQLLISGNEIIRCRSFSNKNITEEYNGEKDIEFYSLYGGIDFNLEPGNFVIVLPNELHAPKLKHGVNMNVRKIVVKILKS
ncbi:MAG: YhcH/YjgK/YiaL family protein [Spirochaetales bacterium]|nr:YhcH/YjgK/YiaL family protein [Spirochaetales bacterium]